MVAQDVLGRWRSVGAAEPHGKANQDAIQEEEEEEEEGEEEEEEEEEEEDRAGGRRVRRCLWAQSLVSCGLRTDIPSRGPGHAQMSWCLATVVLFSTCSFIRCS